jgi:D-tyrosyl-tRNA(Tyr) deacylase
MRAVLQRVSSASVSVDQQIVGAIGRGLLVLVGKQEGDSDDDLEWLAKKILGVRLFADTEGEMRLAVAEIAGELLVVSQFTLLASTRKGTRPSWHRAARPDDARPLYERFVQRLGALHGSPVQTGRFGAMMQVASVNDGPVTVIIDSRLRE